MKLYIKNKLMSLRGNSFVLNEKQENVYQVKGKLFSPTKKKLIKDMDGVVLYKVRNKFFNIFLTCAYITDAHGNKLCKVKHVSLRNMILEDFVDKIELNFVQYGRWDIIKNGTKIGSFSRAFTVVRDAYELEINDDEDVAFFVALAIALDNMKDKDTNK